MNSQQVVTPTIGLSILMTDIEVVVVVADWPVPMSMNICSGEFSIFCKVYGFWQRPRVSHHFHFLYWTQKG